MKCQFESADSRAIEGRADGRGRGRAEVARRRRSACSGGSRPRRQQTVRSHYFVINKVAVVIPRIAGEARSELGQLDTSETRFKRLFAHKDGEGKK